MKKLLTAILFLTTSALFAVPADYENCNNVNVSSNQGTPGYPLAGYVEVATYQPTGTYTASKICPTDHPFYKFADPTGQSNAGACSCDPDDCHNTSGEYAGCNFDGGNGDPTHPQVCKDLEEKIRTEIVASPFFPDALDKRDYESIAVDQGNNLYSCFAQVADDGTATVCKMYIEPVVFGDGSGSGLKLSIVSPKKPTGDPLHTVSFMAHSKPANGGALCSSSEQDQLQTKGLDFAQGQTIQDIEAEYAELNTFGGIPVFKVDLAGRNGETITRTATETHYDIKPDGTLEETPNSQPIKRHIITTTGNSTHYVAESKEDGQDYIVKSPQETLPAEYSTAQLGHTFSVVKKDQNGNVYAELVEFWKSQTLESNTTTKQTDHSDTVNNTIEHNSSSINASSSMATPASGGYINKANNNSSVGGFTKRDKNPSGGNTSINDATNPTGGSGGGTASLDASNLSKDSTSQQIRTNTGNAVARLDNIASGQGVTQGKLDGINSKLSGTNSKLDGIKNAIQAGNNSNNFDTSDLNKEVTQQKIQESLNAEGANTSANCNQPPQCDVKKPFCVLLKQSWKEKCAGYSAEKNYQTEIATDPFQGRDELAEEFSLQQRIADITQLEITGTCPSSRVMTVLGKELTISSQPYCDFAQSIRPLVLMVGTYLVILVVVRTF